MILDKSEGQFIKANQEILEQIFKKELEESKQLVFRLPAGQERDLQIEFIKKYEEWLLTIGICSQDVKQPDNNI